MRYLKWTVLGILLLVLPSLVVDAASNSKTVGKNPGKIKGRWLQVDDLEALRGYDRVYVGDVIADIHGVGSGMGLKLAGGSARKMTQDDIQENTKNLMELLREVR